MDSPPDKDLGIIAVLLRRLEAERLPPIVSMVGKVNAGGILSDGDIEWLRRVLEDAEASHLGPLLERHPDYREVAAAEFSAYRQILERDLRNERVAWNAR